MASEPQYEEWNRSRRRWIDITQEALTYVYASDRESKEFASASTRSAVLGGQPWPDRLQWDSGAASRGVDKLEALLGRLAYATDPFMREAAPTAAATPDENAAPPGPPVIFLVHGRDHGLRAEVARFLERAGDHAHEIVTLDEKASRGKTLVEKLEQHASGSRYAVVLLTGDDEGGLRGKEGPSDLQPRARQNVVFELGWFCGQLGREHVTVLREPDVERPSDIEGLVYISTADDWQRQLVRELTDAGFDFDSDRA